MLEAVQQNEISKQIADRTHRWYSLSVVSGQEHLVVENLKERVKKQNLFEDITDFLVPEVQEVTMKQGKKIIKPKKLYPGYLFIKMRMDDKLWYVVRNTPGVKLIVGADTRPIPLTDSEYDVIMQHVLHSDERASMYVPFQIDDVVILKAGDFENMKGKVKDIDEENALVVVNIEILGRLTPVVLPFEKVAHIN
jgi:transcription termination/antitermination protein NusG